MADPSASLRSILLFDGRFDHARIRALCIQITAAMEDHDKAAHLMQIVMDEVDALELAIDMDQPDVTIRAWRMHAINAADRMIKAALR